MHKLIFGTKVLLAMTAVVVSMSCSVGRSRVNVSRPERKLYGWHDDGGSGKISICISLADQVARIVRGGRDIGWCYVATGKEGHDTRPGDYQIMEKIEDKHSNRYGWIEDELGNVVDGDAQPGDRVPEGMVYVPAPMPNWMRLTSYGVGMHGGLIPEPGKPASHGCIRLPKEFAPVLFDLVDVGTPVTIIRGSHPVDPRLQDHSVIEGETRVVEMRPLSKSELRKLNDQ